MLCITGNICYLVGLRFPGNSISIKLPGLCQYDKLIMEYLKTIMLPMKDKRIREYLLGYFCISPQKVHSRATLVFHQKSLKSL